MTNTNNLVIVILLVLLAIGGIFFAYKAGKNESPTVIKEVTREVPVATDAKEKEDDNSIQVNLKRKIEL